MTAVTAVAVALTMATPAYALPAADHAETQALLNSYQASAGPGAAVHAGNRTSSWDVHAGTADTDANRPIGSNDQFRIASQTKTFTAVAVLQLVDEGKVELDAPIERYLPGVVSGNGYDGTKISVRQILQHTSGITGDMGAPRAGADGSYSLREVIRAGLAGPPQFPPGTRWGYSNVNYMLAGLLIEQITGMTAGAAITARIITPLGLTRTSYPRPADRQLTTPYLPGYMGGRAGPFFFWLNQTFAHELSKWATAGAMASTEQDLTAFTQALADGRLVSPATLAQMRTTVPMPGYPEGMGYGLGLWRLDLTCGGQAWGHFGDLTTGHSSGTFATDDGRHAALVTNAYVGAEGKTSRVQVVNSALCGTPAG
ncbi:serine hydrolase domain-containing protein [Kibdelosporangium phytohabitans]|uniref:serine hydrolase domain-containing protein n=1 Tax=Kibdelosporangium phytohabitans TaxID=860235 RepID=UPI001A0D57D4|nr:serine hydrolase domain-containing protein [Kibdelosporangium phytohabitans]MBE1470550.1 D-alanyl-D-alanine carboxypeptidase [Kibdelosporangium phytohabitans]